MKVTMHAVNDDGDDEVVGTVTWNGEKMIANPADYGILQDIATELMKQPDPMAAMKTLPMLYKTAYMRAEIDEHAGSTP